MCDKQSYFWYNYIRGQRDNMARMYKVKYSDDKIFEVEEGTKLIEIAK